MAQEWCLRNSHVLDDSLSFHDLGVSAYRGANAETGRLGDFLEAVRAGQVAKGSILLVEALDRLSRLVPRKAQRVLEDIVDQGITVVTLNDQRQYTAESMNEDPLSLLQSILVFMRANEESETKGRRVRAAWEAKRSNASTKPLTSITPAWVTLNKATGRIDPIPERVKIVKRIYRMTLDGHGSESIAKSLEQEGVKPWGRGKFWHKTYIQKIQRYPAVMGWYTPHTETYTDGKAKRNPQATVKGYFPAVIDEETFNAVQAMKLQRSPKQSVASGGIQSLLAGLARCPNCGATMTRVMKGNAKKAGPPKLVCTTAKRGAGCEYRGVHQEHVEAAILENIEWLVATIPSNCEDLDAEWKQLETNFDATNDAIEGVVEALTLKPLPSLIDKLSALEQGKEVLQGQMRELALKIGAESDLVLEKRAKDALEVLRAEPLDRQKGNAALRRLFDAVIVDYESGTLEMQWKHGQRSEVIYGFPKDDANTHG
jgi:DNA invertase Pin-like site-specific DNA recombinase